ncbi:MAG: glycoside hydrolase family 43 protein [Clostridia bacterium]|nr:glycoside hydrolase family 43 protein [Clostridia bacterium]
MKKAFIAAVLAGSTLLCQTVGFAQGITRVEFAQSIAENLSIPPKIYNGEYADVTDNDQFADTLAGVTSAGVFDGDFSQNGNFNPHAKLLKEEAVAAAVKSLIYRKVDFPTLDSDLVFEDKEDISPSLLLYIEAAVASGLIDDGESFNPKAEMSADDISRLWQAADEVYAKLPLHIGSEQEDKKANEIREHIGSNDIAREYFYSAMQGLIAGTNEDELSRAHEELELAYGAINSERDSILTGSYIFDDNDGLIQAHGGNVIWDDKAQKYYWYGEARKTSDLPEHLKKYGDWGWRTGVGCYSSDDLYNWKYEGLALEMLEEGDGLEYPESDIGLGRVIERPKVIYNKKTGKYVMWMHIDNGWYGYSRAGVAVSDSPVGPFSYLGSYRPGDKMSRDMTVFVDDDESAYLYFSTDENGCLACCKLSEDYLSCVGEAQYCIWWKWREAPAVFKYNSTYYMITSGCSGWSPNAADYATAPTPTGPWTQHGNPCVGSGSDKTFGGQSYWVLTVDAKKGHFIFMADIWRPGNHNESSYIWLPIQMQPDGGIRIEWIDEWSLDDIGNILIEPQDVFATYGEEIHLPETITAIVQETAEERQITWEQPLPTTPGHYSIAGSAKGFADSSVAIQLYIIPKHVVYFADCGAESDGELQKIGSGLFNSVPDCPYGADEINGKKWGCTTEDASGTHNDKHMFWSVRYGSEDAKNITYHFEVDKTKKYDVYVGIKDPWNESARYIDIEVQGVKIVSNLHTHNVQSAWQADGITAEGGEITVASVRNENSNAAPIISWIMICEAN